MPAAAVSPGWSQSGPAAFATTHWTVVLAAREREFVEAARGRPELARVTTTFLPAVPQLFVKVDRDKVLKQGVIRRKNSQIICNHQRSL